jgi:hypothetical protein
LKALTDEGREILHFEDEIGKVLLQLFPSVLLHEDSGAIYTEFMGIVLNVIKYNSAYLVTISLNPIETEPGESLT